MPQYVSKPKFTTVGFIQCDDYILRNSVFYIHAFNFL